MNNITNETNATKLFLFWRLSSGSDKALPTKSIPQVVKIHKRSSSFIPRCWECSNIRNWTALGHPLMDFHRTSISVYPQDVHYMSNFGYTETDVQWTSDGRPAPAMDIRLLFGRPTDIHGWLGYL